MHCPWRFNALQETKIDKQISQSTLNSPKVCRKGLLTVLLLLANSSDGMWPQLGVEPQKIEEWIMAYKYIAEAWKKPEESFVKKLMWQRAIKWRKQDAIIRIKRPTRLDRARNLGYKAKQGIILARIRVRRSGFRKTRPTGGRRQKRLGVNKFKVAKNMRLIAEERVR